MPEDVSDVAVARSRIISACYAIPGQCWPVELGWLFDELQHSKAHVEVGSYCGRSLLASCGGMQESVVWSIEPFRCLPVNLKWHKRVYNATCEFISETCRGVGLIKQECGSIEAARKLCNEGILLDSIYIDGDHHYAEVKADIQSWMPLIKPGGLICGHDYWAADTGVMDAVNECVPGFQVAPNTRIWWSKF